MVTSGRSLPIVRARSLVSGSESGPVPEYCASPRCPIGRQRQPKFRFRSTARPLVLVPRATPSGFAFGITHRSSPGGSGTERRRFATPMPARSFPWMQPTTRMRRVAVGSPLSKITIARPSADRPRRASWTTLGSAGCFFDGPIAE